MDDSQKPFACTIQGCEMTFTNEDHLNWHHKKHDMVLNVGLANKNVEVADQTPTPTRFIRNCEEVGLFQDLQNVNPFDETFKKAIESAKSGTLHVPDVASNDDTLHTPHIFPHVDNSDVKYTESRIQSSHSNDFCINNVPSIENNNENNENYHVPIVEDTSNDNTNNKHTDLKNKLKESIKNKVKTPIIISEIKLNDNETNLKRTLPEKDDVNNKKQKSDKEISEERAKIREMNRAAQLRCRKRKQIQWKKMEEELKMLKSENAKLNLENQNFRHQFYALKEVLLKHKNTNSSDIALLPRIEQILNSSPKTNLLPQPLNKHRMKNKVSTASIIPSPVVQNSGQTLQKPVLIQVMGSVSQLAVSVLPNK